MLLTDHSRNETDTGQATQRPVSLRLCSGAPDEPLIQIVAGKHSVGSGPRCSVRLQGPGVRPLHCLIFHDAQGVRVRRWATDTLLNGEAFDEAPLASGDLLSVGSIELEVVESTPAVEAESPPDAAADWEVAEPGQTDPHVPQPATGEVDRLREASTAARRRSRKLLAALRGNRDELLELIQRIDALERKVETALDQRASHAIGQQDAEPVVAEVHESESPFGAWDQEHSASAAEFPQDEEQGEGATAWASAAASPAESESASSISEWPESTGGSAESEPSDPALVAELTATAQQLVDTQQRLADAQATIDALEQQLAEQHQERQLLADERADWLRQMTELEARLSEYAQRVPELEAQLEQLCEAGEAAARVRRSSSREAPAVPLSAAPDEEYSWATRGGGDAPLDKSDLDRHRWSSPAAAAEPTEPAAAARPSEGEPASEFGWSTDRGATSPIGTDVDVTDDDETSATDSDEVDASAGEAASVRTHGMQGIESDASAEAWSVDMPSGEPSTQVEPEPVEASATAGDDDVSVDAEAGDVPMPAATPVDPERKQDELEGVVAQLRGRSLWRDEADDMIELPAELETTGESAPAVESPPAEESATDRAAASADANEPVAAADSRTASFLDRYAHLFEDEESGRPSPPVSQPLATADQGSMADSIEPPAARPSVTEPATAGGADEESIEQYMAKMMQRLGGDSSSAPASQAPAAAPQPSTTAASASGSATISDPATADVDRPQRKRGPAPEDKTDMAALRALANQTARHAIGVHTAGQMRRHAVTRFIIAMLAGTASLYFFLTAPGWESFEFVTASVALLASIYWGRLTFGSLIQGVRVGAFDDYEPEFATVDSVSEQLPIDVEH